jgi:CheY-like chemotaxis protein
MVHALETLKVLVVDDNAHVRAIARGILKSAGVGEIREAPNGRQALDVLKEWEADLVIIDFQMSPVDGLELTRRIRDPKGSPNPFMPIVMMTSYADRRLVIEARDAGVSEFLVKPVTAKGLLDRVEAAVFKPRPFVETDDYFGPTRRGVDAPDVAENPRRREGDTRAG